MAGRGVPGLRPGTASRNVQNISQVTGRPPGTATRLTTAAGARPGTRGGMPAGAGVGLNVQVDDRPMTQQGLGGAKIGGKGPHRTVQDKSYFLGLIRTKIAELHIENQKIRRDIVDLSEEQKTYLSYEKKAESLAKVIRDLQSQMGDYNTLVDKLNTNANIQEIQRDYEELKAKNAHETRAMEGLYSQKQSRDQKIHDLEVELDQERKMAESLVADMPSDRQQRYLQMKKQNEAMLAKQERLQQQLDEMSTRRADLEDSLAMSSVKQEAIKLYESIAELTERRDAIRAEMQQHGSPAEQREKLLAQVKKDNQDMASMDRQTNEMNERIENLRDEINQLDQDMDENVGERSAKYQELKKKEAAMDEFLQNYDENVRREREKVSTLGANITSLLEAMSRRMAKVDHLPSPQELATMRNDLEFKEREMKHSKTTASGLNQESQKLKSDLQKVEQLDEKIRTELTALNEKIDKMQDELAVYTDLNRLEKEADAKRTRLEAERKQLESQLGDIRRQVETASAQYESTKSRLSENETYTALRNIEAKWQQYEQNNFVMKEFIEQRRMETDYRGVKDVVNVLIGEYNTKLSK